MPRNSLNRLVLFDIDGTLLRIDGKVNHHILGEAISGCGVDATPLYGQSFAGKTDRNILLSVPGVSEEHVELINRSYCELMEQKLQSSDIQVLPGVEEVLIYLRHSGVATGLITGNLMKAAFTKLRKAGLGSYFSTGAFGDRHQNRNFLPAMARKAASEQYGCDFSPEQTVIIGDTPNDITCGRYDGCYVIAVATGVYTGQQLAECQPDLLLDNLKEPQQWLDGFFRSIS